MGLDGRRRVNIYLAVKIIHDITNADKSINCKIAMFCTWSYEALLPNKDFFEALLANDKHMVACLAIS